MLESTRLGHPSHGTWFRRDSTGGYLLTVHIEGLSFSYGRRRVISELTWKIPPGVTGLIGPNGSGKTTLLNCITGLTRPCDGIISFVDSTTRRDSPIDLARRTDVNPVGYVPQEARAPGRMRVVNIVEYCAWLNGVSNSDCHRLASEAIVLLGLEELSRRRFGSLSGGERRRVMIAAGLAHKPSILVLDEPTVGLDPGQRLTVRRALASLQSVDTILLATHLVEDIEHLCTCVGILHRGRISYAGSTHGLLEQAGFRPESSDKKFGSAFEHAYEALLDKAVAANGDD